MEDAARQHRIRYTVVYLGMQYIPHIVDSTEAMLGGAFVLHAVDITHMTVVFGWQRLRDRGTMVTLLPTVT